eukprot:TRINITY_DN8916_c0_g1_i1.p6 TRINITY_DN8916_c0_g1~~TRINITY_DN8916_c0_g1_i1.p6  ORF type:complete len:119 (-),score=9.58 TRINITY_DN8916_c0_g1_i1:969-1325(-)
MWLLASGGAFGTKCRSSEPHACHTDPNRREQKIPGCKKKGKGSRSKQVSAVAHHPSFAVEPEAKSAAHTHTHGGNGRSGGGRAGGQPSQWHRHAAMLCCRMMLAVFGTRLASSAMQCF